MTSPAIRLLGDPVLRTAADPVRSYDAASRRLIDRMFAAMDAADGVGLAAPQIGVSLRVFVYDVGGRQGHVVNPELTVDDAERLVAEEGCLSIPGHHYPTPRAAAVTVRGQDACGAPITVRGRGEVARCWQHEVDHLDGRLYIDRLDPRLRREALLNIDG